MYMITGVLVTQYEEFDYISHIQYCGFFQGVATVANFNINF